MNDPDGIWAVVPIKEFGGAKQRLAGLLTAEQRRALAACMAEDVLEALAAVPELAGILVVTKEPVAIALAQRYGAQISTDGARSGHTGAVAAAAQRLVRERRAGMITLPGDIPAVTAAEISATLAVHKPSPSFTIVPAHDELGSNAIVVTPPDALPLQFGDNSFFPHLDSARRAGLAPTIIRHPGIAMDIDHPADLDMFLSMKSLRPTRTRAFLEKERPRGSAPWIPARA
ncbi:MAG TPA: 2-phospho-L-lactate guanylyltransferase [Acetobacteraceae bacterium]|nr:2-phospho-L-lactate guanylyltransferase [Acetobacteraceae bacterium]